MKMDINFNSLHNLQLFGVILVFTLAPMSDPNESIIWEILFHSAVSSNGDQTDFIDDCGGWEDPDVFGTPLWHEDDSSLTDLSSDVAKYK